MATFRALLAGDARLFSTLHAQEGPEAVAPGIPGHYFTFPDREALARFHRAGHRLVDPALLAPILSSYYPY